MAKKAVEGRNFEKFLKEREKWRVLSGGYNGNGLAI
jgi:hypothetical protein